jgi:hypothetical protein
MLQFLSVVTRYGDEWASFKFEAVFDSYGYLGAPIFNGVGHLVGISYDDGDAWSVSLIQDVLFRGAEIRRYYAFMYSLCTALIDPDDMSMAGCPASIKSEQTSTI